MEKRQPNDATASTRSDNQRPHQNDIRHTPTPPDAPRERDREVAFLKDLREKRSKF